MYSQKSFQNDELRQFERVAPTPSAPRRRLVLPKRILRLLLLSLLLVTGIVMWHSGTPMSILWSLWGEKQPAATTASPVDPTVAPAIHDQDVPEALKNLHKVPKADAYLPYFRQIAELPSITMNEAASGCDWGDKFDRVNFQYTIDTEWIQNPRPDSEITTKRQEWHEFISKDLIPWSKVSSSVSGRGIVILAGNEASLARVKVILRLLTALESEIDVEVHHWGAEEINAFQKAELQELWPDRLFFNDLSKKGGNFFESNHDNIFGVNYQLKSAAIVNSRFEEFLLMDSDNTPWVAPEKLFESETYKEYGTVFWPDIARTRPQNPMWAITGTKCRMDEYEQESGQMLVDKRRYWYHLQLAAWFNAQNYYNDFLLGDKDMFRFAWHALKTPYGRPKHWLGLIGVEQRKPNDVVVEVDKNMTVTKRDKPPPIPFEGVGELEYTEEQMKNSHTWFCGHHFAQYYPDNDTIAFIHGGLFKAQDSAVVQWNRATGGMFRHIKQSPGDTDMSYVEPATINFDSGSYVGFGNGLGLDRWNQSFKPLKVGQCSEYPDVKTTRLNGMYELALEKAGVFWKTDGEPKPQKSSKPASSSTRGAAL